ncbi:MAG TPA: hypothetical protein VMT03_18950 [Polyangia bacterium]|nr:hypothetical protein [Polyangia bacterium]
MTRFSLVVCATLLALSPAAFAKSKKKKKSATPAAAAAAPAAEDTEQPAGEEKQAPPEKPVQQSEDVEKPKAILDMSQEAPKTDSLGHVHFSSPNGEGLGRVVVNAPATQKVKVFLEGRLFGIAPVTIYSVPKGDYIVEALYPDGKQVSKPVTVSENEQTVVDLNAKVEKTTEEAGSSGYTGSEMTPTRKNLMWGFIIGAGVGLVAGATFGILELKAESDYQNTPSNDQAQLDSIQQRGQRYADVADVGWVVTAVGVVGAAICALPMIFGPSEKGAGGTSAAMTIAPVAGHGITGGTLLMRF